MYVSNYINLCSATTIVSDRVRNRQTSFDLGGSILFKIFVYFNINFLFFLILFLE